jgi:hypothetical protein
MTRQLLFRGLFVVGVLSGSPAPATTASFATAVTSTNNQFAAGNLRISNSFAVGTNLSMDHLLAGDSFDVQLNITNGGSLSQIYAMAATLTDSAALATALQLTIRAKLGANPCANRDGGILYTGALVDAKIGDRAYGGDPGDRSLAAGATDALCFTVELPNAASPSLLDTNITASFVFYAEQDH